MTSCFTWFIFLAFAIFCMVSLIRWFEQITEAVDYGWWNKVALLLAVPLTVWFFESKVAAGRPTAVPRHEPVRGFGTGPAMPKDLPKPPAKKKRSSVDPEMLAKLKQKMK
ncbi:MAG TPA: hypothetical protein VKK61_06035, partial [Tepidisphaeraceae bacterium]|nr:hypothetical protein [Tepidisphaeraceae bacterium]